MVSDGAGMGQRQSPLSYLCTVKRKNRSTRTPAFRVRIRLKDYTNKVPTVFNRRQKQTKNINLNLNFIMAKVKPMGLIESMSGKVCKHSDVYFFRRNGKIFTGKMCHPSTKAPTEAQTAQQKHPRRHCLDGMLAHAVARKRSDKNRHRAS